MAKFTIAVAGTLQKDLLVLEQSISTSCESVFTFSVNADSSDSITITLTVNSGTAAYNMTVNGAPETSPHTYSSTGEDEIKLYMKNSAILDTLEIEVEVNNTTDIEVQTETVSRDSTGSIC